MLRKRTLAGVAFCLLLSGLVFLPLSPAHAVSCGQKSVQAWTNNTNGNTTHYGVKAAWGIWVPDNPPKGHLCSGLLPLDGA